MRNPYANLIIVFILLFSVTSCHKKNEGIPLARVFDKYLYISDLKGLVPKGMTAKDSVQFVKNFIDNWTHQNVLVVEADDKLPSSEKDFTLQLNDYRNSLLIYEYDKAVINHNLDTVVKDDEITKYYNDNQQEFELRNNIVKVIYIKLVKGSPYTSRFKQLLSNINKNPQNHVQLANLAPKNAVNYFLDDQSWLLFDDLLKEVPVNTYNQEQFLQNNRYIEIADKEFIYMLLIEDFKIKETASPLSFEKENIRKILLQKRKIKLIQKAHEDLYSNAMNNKDVEIF